MDVMLRFQGRHDALEEELRNCGYGIIVPTRRQKPIPPERFQISVGVLEPSAECADCLRPVFMAIRKIQDALTRYSTMTRDAELDFGIAGDEIGFVKSLHFDRDFLELLTNLGIMLTVSVYGCRRDGAGD